jgi:hypothetical protein
MRKHLAISSQPKQANEAAKERLAALRVPLSTELPSFDLPSFRSRDSTCKGTVHILKSEDHSTGCGALAQRLAAVEASRDSPVSALAFRKFRIRKGSKIVMPTRDGAE